MPYDAVTIREADHVKGLQNAVEDDLHGLYDAILHHFFGRDRNYIIEHQKMGPGGKPEFIVIRHDTPGKRNPVLIVELKRPSKWTTAGKQEIMQELTAYIEGRLDMTEYSMIYGLAGIGVHWTACYMKKAGGPNPVIVQPWHDDITSAQGYNLMQAFANTVHNIK
ncbi:hypothetical protein BD410DRAFT_843580 [Rickenella mellea]|uniref:Fungal-type protein kinase domain-containing protein n=1 Tax=Rickenella mellea TaxID=50990 RepID=A0A4Y7PSR5_9AGAM|nr:hypothetical protein BD410DRAFT_843580 [Rickenella mellea]